MMRGRYLMMHARYLMMRKRYLMMRSKGLQHRPSEPERYLVVRASLGDRNPHHTGTVTS